MTLPRSSYYYGRKALETSSEQRALTDRIEGITEEFPRYGYRKVTAQLHREGLLVNHKKIQRIMRERGFGSLFPHGHRNNSSDRERDSLA
jgi:putative transposase